MSKENINILIDRMNISKKKQFFNGEIDSEELISALPTELQAFKDCPYLTLSDCLDGKKFEVFNVRALELYTEWFKVDIADIITIFHISQTREQDLNRVVKNICVYSYDDTISDMQAFAKMNIDYLRSYKYLDEELLNDLVRLEQVVEKESIVRLDNNRYLRLCSESASNFSVLYWENNSIDVDKVFEENFICSIHDLKALSESWEFYIKKAKNRRAQEAVFSTIECEFEFIFSLFCINYKKILESENAFICLKKNVKKVRGSITEYKAKCDLSILFKDNVKIFRIQSGLGDQIRYYILARFVQDRMNSIVLYDDLFMQKQDVFNGLEIEKVANEDKEDLKKRLLSNIVSKQLQSVYTGTPIFPDFLYEKGWHNVVSVIMEGRANRGRGRYKANYLAVGVTRDDILLTLDDKYNYYYILSSPEKFIDRLEDFNRYILLPEPLDEMNKRIASEMLTCDAVAIHVRCGDMFSFPSQASRPSFFRECLTELVGIEEYNNKKYFIFSDDIKWVQAHEEELGISLLDKSAIRYIDHNKNDNSFWDMKLISLARIIIGSYSGFSRMGALAGIRKEIYVCQADEVNRDMKRMGWKNKYELQMRNFGYEFISRDKINIDGWSNILNGSRVVLESKKTNYNYYRYNLLENCGSYSIHLSDISSDVNEFTMGLFDFVHNRIVHYEKYKTNEDCWLNFNVGVNVEDIALCIYAGVFGDTSGHNISIDKLTISFKSRIEK